MATPRGLKKDRKRHGANGPRQNATRLRPWLGLANELIRDKKASSKSEPEPRTTTQQREREGAPLLEFVRAESDTRWFPAKRILGWFSRPTDARAQELLRQDKLGASSRLLALARNVQRVLEFYTDASEEPVPYLSVSGGRSSWFLFSRGKDNRPAVEPFDPFRDFFLAEFSGVALDRIGRCPICKCFFYRLRTGEFGTKACQKPKPCNNTFRNQVWRLKEEDLITKVGAMFRAGKRYPEIVGALGVKDKTRARRLVHKAQERNEKSETQRGRK